MPKPKAKARKGRFAKAVGNPNDSRGLVAAMRRFLEHRGVIGNREATLYNLEASIRFFIEWADARSVTHPEHVTRAVLERYQRWLYHYRKKDGMPLSIGTCRARIAPLKSFFKWLTRMGDIPANPASEIDMPRRALRLPRHVMTESEVERVLAGADTSTALGLRDRAMMEVLYATGIRRMELSQLRILDVDSERVLVMVREGKGGKDRMVPLGERALYWVQEYLDRGRGQLVWNMEDTTLFLSMEGRPIDKGWLSKAVAQYITKADIGKTGSCHLFRHTMATLMLEGGADIRFIQAMLGHADLTSTQIYTQVAIKLLQQVHANTHPGVKRRTRSDQTKTGDTNPQPDSENAAQVLFDALDAETQADDEDDEK